MLTILKHPRRVRRPIRFLRPGGLQTTEGQKRRRQETFGNNVIVAFPLYHLGE